MHDSDHRPVGRRVLAGLLVGGCLLLALLDLWPLMPPSYLRTLPAVSLLPLLSGPVVAGLAFLPGRRLGVERRAAAAVVVSAAVTAVLAGDGTGGGWGLLESAGLLGLMTRTARRARPRAALALGLPLTAAAVAGPARVVLADAGPDAVERWFGFAFVLMLCGVGAAGLGWYLRMQDDRRERDVAAVRQGERLRIARDLHDSVAHGVTAMLVQTQAARAVRDSAPQQVGPLLDGIERAGQETMDAMHRLVRVLRESPDAAVRPGELLAELGALTAQFGPGARLSVSAGARAARLDPEVETAVHCLVQEALTNVRRHAPGAEDARVDVDLGEDGALRVAVTNGPSAAVGGGVRSGGFGLVGLRERVEAVGGTWQAGPVPTDAGTEAGAGTSAGGWRVTGTFPVRSKERPPHEAQPPEAP